MNSVDLSTLERDELMTQDLFSALRAAAPNLRGDLEANASLAPISWFRAGGAAELLFTPVDFDDLRYFLGAVQKTPLARQLPILTIGLGSNLLVRDGGVAGIVIRLGRGFMQVERDADERVR